MNNQQHKKFMGKLSLLVFFLFATSLANGQETNQLSGLDAEIEALQQLYNAVGLAVAVVKNDSIIYSKGFGYRDLENQLPVTTHTVFNIGSITKAFTGTLLGILESQNRVSLKDKPSLYLSKFEFYNDKMNSLIVIEDLLSHKSGIGNTGTADVFFPTENKLKAVQRLKYLKPEAEVKNSFEYSNMGYTLAGTIVEQITSKSWESNVHDLIFEPLSMSNSSTTYEEMRKTNNYSLPYGAYQGNIEKVKYEDFYSLRPAGAVKSTVIDLSNWMITWLNNGVFNQTQIIPKDYVDKATKLQNIKPDSYDKDSFLYGEGFGWRLKSSYGHYRIDHGGNTYGFSTNLVMFPFEKIGIVVLTNQDNSWLPYIVTDNITRRLFELNPEPEYPVIVSEIYHPDSISISLNKDKTPTHALTHFVGTYKAQGFGEIEIVMESNILYAVLPTFKFQLEHLSFNSFRLKGTKEFKDVFNPEFNIQFVNDTNGNISHLKLYSQKEPIEFYRE